MKIIISPYSQKLKSGKTNPKNFPYWKKVVQQLNDLNHTVIQIGVTGEEKIDGVTDFAVDKDLKTLTDLVKSADLWISVDNFFPHFCNTINSNGIVIFSRSDPKIFGYEKNINILKDTRFLRSDQFGIWEQSEYDIVTFVEPNVVIDEVVKFLNKV